VEKTVSAYEIQRSFGEMLQDVVAHGDKFVVERHGTPVAVVVPVEVYEQWKQSQERFFETLRKAQGTADMSEADAEKLAAEAVKAARAK
jgi:prevent-host-death family protein